MKFRVERVDNEIENWRFFLKKKNCIKFLILVKDSFYFGFVSLKRKRTDIFFVVFNGTNGR